MTTTSPQAATPQRRAGRAPLTALAALACTLLAGLPGPAAAADPKLARAEEIVTGKCFICHGADGESSSPVFPRLAGQNADYITQQLKNYKAGTRKSTTMQPMVEDLAAEDFAALGAWFESRPKQIHAVADTELSDVGRFIYVRGNPYSGVPACATCHGPTAQGTPALPRLAGQHAQYSENQLKAFATRQRDNAIMHGIASKLSELEIKAVSAFLSGIR